MWCPYLHVQHMQLNKSCKRQTTAVITTIVVYLGNIWMEDLKIMTTTIDTSQWTQGRARGLLLVWRRELE